LVASLARPGANVTGLSMMLANFSAKRLQPLKGVLPQATRVAVLSNPTVPWHAKVIEELKAAAPSRSIELSFAGARTPEEIGPAFSAVNRTRAQALFVIEDPLFLVRRTTFSTLASNARLPTMYGNRRYVDAGGLMSYGPSYGDLFRRSARRFARVE
jgi:putative ABC transport system substrate-binding protein